MLWTLAAAIAGVGQAALAQPQAAPVPSQPNAPERSDSIPGVSRTVLQKSDRAISGHDVLQVRVDLAPGAVFPRHMHPGDEFVYVLEGTLEYRLDRQPRATLKAGDVLVIPAGTIHAVENVGLENASELATYVLEKGKPAITLVK